MAPPQAGAERPTAGEQRGDDPVDVPSCEQQPADHRSTARTIEPTLRSISPLTITNVIPTAMIPISATCWPTFSRFARR
ncbi:MAG: hypothetical protein WKG07_36135 [Hymenobacter sp.]